MHGTKEVRRTLVSAVFGMIKEFFDNYGDYDVAEAEDIDIFGNPMEMYYQYTLDGHFFEIRNAGYPDCGDGMDVDVFYNGNVEITIYCCYEVTKVPLIVFDDEDDIDSAVKQAQEVIGILLERIGTGFSVHYFLRYLSRCNGDYTWKDALKDYKDSRHLDRK